MDAFLIITDAHTMHQASYVSIFELICETLCSNCNIWYSYQGSRSKLQLRYFQAGLESNSTAFEGDSLNPKTMETWLKFLTSLLSNAFNGIVHIDAGLMVGSKDGWRLQSSHIHYRCLCFGVIIVCNLWSPQTRRNICSNAIIIMKGESNVAKKVRENKFLPTT